MNYSAYSVVILGRLALEKLEGILEAMLEPEDLFRWAEGEDTEHLRISFQNGYAIIEIFPEEGEATEVAYAGYGFALEAGPDSGGPGWVFHGPRDETVPLYPENLAKAAHLYEDWLNTTPPIAPTNQEAEKTLRKALSALAFTP